MKIRPIYKFVYSHQRKLNSLKPQKLHKIFRFFFFCTSAELTKTVQQKVLIKLLMNKLDIYEASQALPECLFATIHKYPNYSTRTDKSYWFRWHRCNVLLLRGGKCDVKAHSQDEGINFFCCSATPASSAANAAARWHSSGNTCACLWSLSRAVETSLTFSCSQRFTWWSLRKLR